jgi:SAM-dependent methyltransferase
MEAVIAMYFHGAGVSSLVDFGCGNMPYRPLFESHVQKYIGVDILGNELADAVLGSTGSLPVENESVDVVLSSQVLEHVPDPPGYLKEAHRALKSEGTLVLSTHGVWRYHPDPTDYWRWTSDGLRRLLAQSAFEVLRFKGVMGPEATALQLWQDAVLRRVPKRLKNSFTRYMQWRIRRADLRCPDQLRDRDACVYVVVARKG